MVDAAILVFLCNIVFYFQTKCRPCSVACAGLPSRTLLRGADEDQKGVRRHFPSRCHRVSRGLQDEAGRSNGRHGKKPSDARNGTLFCRRRDNPSVTSADTQHTRLPRTLGRARAGLGRRIKRAVGVTPFFCAELWMVPLDSLCLTKGPRSHCFHMLPYHRSAR